MSWTADKDRLGQLARSFDPAVRLTTKDGWFWKAIAWILFVVTFGRFARADFLEAFATTIGPVQAYPASWPTESVERVIPHESHHTHQARILGLGIHPWVGLPVMALLYLLVFLPIGLAYARYRLELGAETASWRHRLSQGTVSTSDILWRADSFAETVSGPAYGWAWPRPWVVAGFRKAAAQVIAEAGRQV